MKKTILVVTLALFAASCEQSKEDLITRKWNAVHVENSQMDEMMRQQQAMLDTMGKNGDDATNLAIYGVTNVDSMRQSLQAQMDDFKKMQDTSIKNTYFDFKKNKIVLMNFSGQMDSTKWSFDDEGMLILDEQQMTGAGSTLKMQVIKLDKDTLKLKFSEDGGGSTVTFVPEKK